MKKYTITSLKMKIKLLIISLFILTNTQLIANEWNKEQKVLFQFEEMFHSNWEGDGFNYAASSARYIGIFNTISDDSTFKLLNNVEAVLGVAYNSTDEFKIQENKIAANSSANHKFLNNFNFNGTADLKSRFDFNSNYLLGAIGISFIEDGLSIQENPITLRASFIKNEKASLEFGNYFKLAWKGNLDTNITLTLKLENFYKYGHSFWNESYWNLESMASFQISKIITSHIVLQALYDLKQSKKLQAFEKITIGFTWKL